MLEYGIALLGLGGGGAADGSYIAQWVPSYLNQPFALPVVAAVLLVLFVRLIIFR